MPAINNQQGRIVSFKHLLIALPFLFASTAFAEVDECFELYEVKKQYKQALVVCTKAAEEGIKESQYNLGQMYRNGQGVLQDYKLAVNWYTKAANQGHTSSQYNLGVMCDKGEGVPQDYKQAAHWYTKAAKQGDADAQYNLGIRYYHGQGVLQDYKQAYALWDIAASQGDEMAAKNRGFVAKQMSSAQIEKAQALSKELYAQYMK